VILVDIDERGRLKRVEFPADKAEDSSEDGVMRVFAVPRTFEAEADEGSFSSVEEFLMLLLRGVAVPFGAVQYIGVVVVDRLEDVALAAERA
jgi:hypothetical protein